MFRRWSAVYTAEFIEFSLSGRSMNFMSVFNDIHRRAQERLLLTFYLR